MFVEIYTAEKNEFSGEAKIVKLPGVNGSFEIMNNHAPIISTLEQGKIKIVDNNNKESFFDIKSGVVETNNNKVIILVETI